MTTHTMAVDGSSMCDSNDNFVYDNIADRYQAPNPFTKGERCAVYDSAAPAGRSFTYYGASRKADVDIVDKLNEIKMDNVKSPLVKLNEIALKMKKTIKYETISISGAMHIPVFTIRISSGDVFAYGNGSSKKEAKTNAAIELLNMIDFSKDNNAITSTTSNDPIMKQIVETKLELNPVGVLQEMCMAYHWQMPVYEYHKELCNESNEVKFIAICSLNTFRTKGAGLTKQAAKKQAASLLYDQIKNLSPEDLTAPHNYVKYTKPSEILLNNNQFDKIKSISGGKCNFSESVKCTDMFIANMKLSTNPSVNKLKVLDLAKKSIKAVDFLEKLGKEEGFTSTYIKLRSMTPTSKFILLQASLFPFILNLGEGKTLEEAQETAAWAILSYLKMMLLD